MGRSLSVTTAVGIDFGTLDDDPASWIPEDIVERLAEANIGDTLDDILARAISPDSAPPYPYDSDGEYLPGADEEDGSAYYDGIGAILEEAGLEWDFYGVADYGTGLVLVYVDTRTTHNWSGALDDNAGVGVSDARLEALAGILAALGLPDAPPPRPLVYGRFG